MNILLIGGGGREHALAWKLAQSPMVESIRVVPGNPGIAGLPKCKCVSLDLNDLNKVADYAEEESIDLTVVGPEATLVAGIGDLFRSRGLPIFGPNKNAAELEGSKAFSKNLMKKYNIPTAAYEIFTELDKALEYLKTAPIPTVIKADGLALGKGVIIAQTREEAKEAVTSVMVGSRCSSSRK